MDLKSSRTLPPGPISRSSSRPGRICTLRKPPTLPVTRWTPPMSGKVKLNTDAAFFLTTGNSWAGAVARDREGRVFFSLGRKTCQCASVEEAEAIAVLIGITELSKLYLGPIVVEMDCAIVGKELQSNDTYRSSCFAILSDIRNLLEQFQDNQISIIRRGGNKLANGLAVMAKKIGDSYTLADVPAEYIQLRKKEVM